MRCVFLTGSPRAGAPRNPSHLPLMSPPGLGRTVCCCVERVKQRERQSVWREKFKVPRQDCGEGKLRAVVERTHVVYISFLRGRGARERLHQDPVSMLTGGAVGQRCVRLDQDPALREPYLHIYAQRPVQDMSL